MATSRIYALLWSLFRVQLRRAGMVNTLPVIVLQEDDGNLNFGRHHAACTTLAFFSCFLPFLPLLPLSLSVKRRAMRKQSLDFQFPLLFPPLPLSLPHLLLFVLLQNALFFFLISSQVRCQIPLRSSNLLY